MSEEYECFTVVFEGDIRKLPGNPHKIGSPFGKVRSIGVGDAFKEMDAVREQQEAAGPPPPEEHVGGDTIQLTAAEVGALLYCVPKGLRQQTIEKIHSWLEDRPFTAHSATEGKDNG